MWHIIPYHLETHNTYSSYYCFFVPQIIELSFLDLVELHSAISTNPIRQFQQIPSSNSDSISLNVYFHVRFRPIDGARPFFRDNRRMDGLARMRGMLYYFTMMMKPFFLLSRKPVASDLSENLFAVSASRRNVVVVG